MNQDNLYIRFDWAIKHILRDKANFDILEGLISVLLDEDVKIVELLESESNQDNDRDKFNRVDIKAKNSKGHIIIIEMQVIRQLEYYERILFGKCEVLKRAYLAGKYGEFNRICSIIILYTSFGQDGDYLYRGQTIFKGLHTGHPLHLCAKEEGVLVPYFPRDVFPEYYLVKVNAYNKIPETPLEEWMTYLKTGEIKGDTLIPGLLKLRDKLCVRALNPAQRRVYFEYVDNVMVQNDVLDTARDKGRAIGIGEMRAEGRAEAIIEVARTMKQQGFTDEEISAITNLSLEEIACS